MLTVRAEKMENDVDIRDFVNRQNEQYSKGYILQWVGANEKKITYKDGMNNYTPIFGKPNIKDIIMGYCNNNITLFDNALKDYASGIILTKNGSDKKIKYALGINFYLKEDADVAFMNRDVLNEDLRILDEWARKSYVTTSQLQALGWLNTSNQEVAALNTALDKYGIISKSSIILFLATCAAESGYGAHTLEHGDTENVFLITQYIVNKWQSELDKNNLGADIRDGKVSWNIKNEKLYINNNQEICPAPEGWENIDTGRSDCYDKAVTIFK